MLDEAMGWALLHIGGRYGVTRNLRIEYRRPARIGKAIQVRANVETMRTRTAVVSARLLDIRGRVLARAESEWALVRHERSA